MVKTSNMKVFGSTDDGIKVVECLISDLDVKAESNNLSNAELLLRRELFVELWQKLKDKESLLSQKSRQKWLVEGDANTTYFHPCIKSRGRKNQLVALKMGEKWVEEPREIKREVKKLLLRDF